MKRIALTLMLAVITVTLAVAQQTGRPVQSLSYSGVQLKLGGQEQATIQQLRNQFTVAPLDAGKANVTQYLVSNKSPTETMGVITFRAGKLVKAYRDWTPIESSRLTNKTTVSIYEWLSDFSD